MTGSDIVYQALYRKYRPKKFSEVVGQNSVITVLKNTVRTKHIGHAYLFSGPRGTGKTTIAKIFARAVNCLETTDGEICEKCKNCQISSSPECMDIIEIDAASNNGVDEIRDLRNKVNILPAELNYKVYIIDEVHMLTIGAFNALLKTLEEPPHHVIFILATTDPQKIPATIISRCQCFQFKKLTELEITEHLKEISLKENIKVEDDVLKEIAKSSDGGMRDAIGLLDKISTIKTEKITVDDFLQLNGKEKKKEIDDFLIKIFQNQQKEVLEKIAQFYQNGKDLIQITKQVMQNLRDQLVNYYIEKQALPYPEEAAIDFINLLNNKIMELKKADDVKISLEIMILHFMQEHTDSRKIISREIISKKTIQENAPPSQDKIEKKSSPSIELAKEKQIVQNTINQEESTFWRKKMLIRAKNTMITAQKKELLKEQENWKRIEDFTFDREYGYLACELLDGTPRVSNENTVVISYPYESSIDKIIMHLTQIQDFYQKKVQSTKNLALLVEDKWNTLKKEYIILKKEGKSFSLEEEPIIEQKESKETEKTLTEEDQKIKEAMELFGSDIVEIK